MKLYGLKNCDTCRKALKSLQGTGYDVKFIDIRQSPLTVAKRHSFLAAFGDSLLNRRSTTWRGLAEDQRAAPPDQLLAAHPALMKRPVIETGEALLLGWTPEVQASLLE